MMIDPVTLPELDAATLAELRQRYEETSNAESRTRYQMILLAQQEYKVPQIARMVLRSEDTVRVYLHAHGYECLRPTWTDASQSGRASRLPGKRVRVEVLLAGTTGPEPLPVKDLLEVDLWSQLPADVPELLARLSRADLYAARMRCSLPF